jgi:hypothetical protein
MSWYRGMKRQTYECLPCMERYVESRRDQLAFLKTRALTDDEAEGAREAERSIHRLDRQWLVRALGEAWAQLQAAGSPPDSFAFALYDALLDFDAIQDEAVVEP